MERIRKIRIYGDDNTGIEKEPIAYEPPPEVQARHKNFKILTVSAYVLLFMLLSQSAIFIIYRILLQNSIFMHTFPLIVTVLMVLIAVVLFICEQHTYHSLSYPNIIILMLGEIVTIVGMFMLYHFDIPWLLNATFVFSILFSLYILLFLKTHIIFRISICAFVAVIFFVTDFVTLYTLEFTPRYIYISTNGYHSKVIDENNYFFENDAEKSSININDLEKLTEYVELLAVSCSGVRSVDDENSMSLEAMNDIGIDDFCFGDIVNFNEKYDEDFFKKKSLYFSVIDLQHQDDTITVTDFKYAKSFGRLYMTYSNPDPSVYQFTNEEEGAICIMVLEVTKEQEEKMLPFWPSFITDRTVMTYS
ncbi:MAG: tripartite tricarboxylate transporter TctB family protein [Acutalibacteraceae bacterium]|nr:tripartite tricarboxylate transporter TctB family protein [Acutalibacteraceae bacterium]